MSLNHGDVFRINEEPRHLCVVLFDPARQDESMLLVRFTTLRESWVDDACILQPQDFPPFIRHETTVAFSTALVGKRSQMIAATKQGAFCPLGTLPPATLAKVVEGARKSKELSSKKKSLLPPP